MKYEILIGHNTSALSWYGARRP